MIQSRVSDRLSWLALAVFAVSFLLAVSFVLFEVLDIDGSDFPVPGAGQWISLSEGTHDIRRVLLAGNPLQDAKAPPTIVVISFQGQIHQHRHLTAPHPLPIRIAQRFHIVLPRVSLAGSPSC